MRTSINHESLNPLLIFAKGIDAFHRGYHVAKIKLLRRGYLQEQEWRRSQIMGNVLREDQDQNTRRWYSGAGHDLFARPGSHNPSLLQEASAQRRGPSQRHKEDNYILDNGADILRSKGLTPLRDRKF